MGWLSWIIQEGPKSNHTCFLWERAEGDLSHTQRRQWSCRQTGVMWPGAKERQQLQKLEEVRSKFSLRTSGGSAALLTPVFWGCYNKLTTDWVTADDKFVSQFWRLDGARERFFPVFPSFWGLLTIPGVLWFCNCITPVSTSIVTHPFPLLWLCPNFPLISTLVIGLELR